MEELLYRKIKEGISQWDEAGIYAVSFLVESNKAYCYGDFSNVSCLEISYNTESDCPGADPLSEERWNFAFWHQNTVPIVCPDDPTPETNALFRWYREHGITNPVQEEKDRYDEEWNYIGKGPAGHYELLTMAPHVAARLQKEGFLIARFGHPMPILVHGLEYAWYDLEATKAANPNGEAELFLKTMA